MIDGYKVITCGPVGRRRYFDIQLKYIYKLKNLIDKHIFWLNTSDPEDIAYFKNLTSQDPDFFEIIELPYDEGFQYTSFNVHRFYNYCNEPNTIYIKIDDDIVFIETNEFENFLKFRIQNPQYFLVFANIINNPMCYYLQNSLGKIKSKNHKMITYKTDNIIFHSAYAAAEIFADFALAYTNKNLDVFKFNKSILCGYEHFNIQFISWIGNQEAIKNCENKENMAKCNNNDEAYMSIIAPNISGKYNCIYGNFLVVHYASFAQREILDANPKILDFFKSLGIIHNGLN